MNQQFKKSNNIIGWIMFVIASVVYLLTMERHISFWDTGEYIVSSAKLGITHAPGAALFQLIGAVWSGLAFGDGSLHPILINSLSAICSGFTILFLFWTITHFSKKMIFSRHTKDINAQEKETDLSKSQRFVILFSGVVGALVFTFSDTFWFSATEGEVYAMASTFTALIVWLACKWDSNYDKKRSDKWLILLSLVIGLSVGVHLMAILAIPIVGYIYYARNYKINIKTFLIANAINIVILGIVFQVIFPATMTFFGRTEMFAVNEIGLPFHSGTILAGIVLISLLTSAIYFTRKHQFKALNTIVLSVVFMLIGFSCWLVIPIRANANPHMNLNNPDTALGTLDYFNREQYGSWPIFYGPVYTAHIENQGDGLVDQKISGAEYKKDDKTKSYVKLANRYEYVYNDKHVKFFPKMYNYQPEVMENYANWYGFPEFELAPEYRSNEQANSLYSELIQKKETGELKISDLSRFAEILKIEPPTLWQNIQYFIDYQIGYMFIRYFMWNFSGRQNDWEGHREITRGNWITGFDFVDNIRLGDQSSLPDEYKKNKANNAYYLLPLLLGLIGFLFQLNRNFGIWWGVLVLFILTSVGIIFYTSVKPFEPRERDYALVSSFFAFSIWVGLGVQGICSILKENIFKNSWNVQKPLIVGTLCLSIPVLMAFQNWDDHDRSGRTAAVDFAHNYLQGLDENAILFVYGDNDTYPIWGYQESEEKRIDVKVANFTLMGAPWYIEQVTRKTYEAEAIPTNLKYKDYQLSTNDRVYVLDSEYFQEFNEMDSTDLDMKNASPEILKEIELLKQFSTKDSMTAKEAINFILKKNLVKDFLYKSNEIKPDEGYNFLPVNRIIIPVNKENAIKYGIVSKEEASEMVDYLEIKISKSGMGKAELAMLSMFANYNWDRPIYFSGGGLYDDANLFFLNDYLQYQGLVYKLVPIKTEFGSNGVIGRVNTNELIKIFKGMRWANFKNPKAYFDETSRNYTLSYRNVALRLANALVDENRNEEAKEVLDTIMKEIPMKQFYWDSVLARIASLYLKIGEEAKSNEILTFYKSKIDQKIQYFNSLENHKRFSIISDYQEALTDYNLAIYSELNTYIEKKNQTKALAKFKEYYEPAEKAILELNVQLAQNPSDPILNRKFESQFESLQELLGIGNLVDSTYTDTRAGKLFEKLFPEESFTPKRDSLEQESQE